jgi:hypothetical protein
LAWLLLARHSLALARLLLGLALTLTWLLLGHPLARLSASFCRHGNLLPSSRFARQAPR